MAAPGFGTDGQNGDKQKQKLITSRLKSKNTQTKNFIGGGNWGEKQNLGSKSIPELINALSE